VSAASARRIILAILAAFGYYGISVAQAQYLAFLRAYPPPSAAQASPSDPPQIRPEEESPARRAVVSSDFYDPNNPDLPRLQKHDTAVASLPKDANGFPDWMRALREGGIGPRAGLEAAAAMNVLNLDVIMRNTKEMPYVRFPHNSHTQWLDCSNCHPQPFAPRAGAAKIVMADIFRGKYCGMCHDRVAFITFFSCQRCHSVPQQPESPTQR